MKFASSIKNSDYMDYGDWCIGNFKNWQYDGVQMDHFCEGADRLITDGKVPISKQEKI